MKKLLKAIIAIGLFLWLVPLIWGSLTKDTTKTYEVASAVANDSSLQELKKMSWIKELYVSDGHLNVGVIANEKQWNSPQIALYVCGVLKRNGSDLAFVRFVNIEQVAYQNKSPRQAEMVKFRCRDFALLGEK